MGSCRDDTTARCGVSPSRRLSPPRARKKVARFGVERLGEPIDEGEFNASAVAVLKIADRRLPDTHLSSQRRLGEARRDAQFFEEKRDRRHAEKLTQ